MFTAVNENEGNTLVMEFPCKRYLMADHLDTIGVQKHKTPQNTSLKCVRFHDLRHTFATLTLENGMDVKPLSATIGHVSAATILDIYSHVTDTMQMQAAVDIDRHIGKTDAKCPR